ncbi:MAG: hypothetical protein P4L67_04790 [Candidatus Pacebacteria bacterium]|nr:hypothetical protein [Candidatus Paceibacterota bacterium]
MAGFDDGDDGKRAGTQGYLYLGYTNDAGAGTKFVFLTKPPGRDRTKPLAPTFVPIRSWEARTDVQTSDVTSSVHYDSSMDLVFAASLPVAIQTDVRIEGVFNVGVVPYTLMTALFDGSVIAYAQLGISATDQYWQGYFLVTNFFAKMIIDGVMTYTAVLKSYGGLSRS